MHRELSIHVHAGSTRLIAVKATLDSDHRSQYIGPMFGQVADALDHAFGALEIPIAPVKSPEPAWISWSGTALRSRPGKIVDLPDVTAACGVHLAAMTGIRGSWQSQHRWIVDNSYDFDRSCACSACGGSRTIRSIGSQNYSSQCGMG